MKLLADLTIKEFETLLADAPKYRAMQLFKWVSLGAKYEEMSDIPIKIRQRLKNGESLGNNDDECKDKDSDIYGDTAVEIIKEESAQDGSVKMLYKLWDGNAIEGIFMPHSYGNTLCVSTQVGCRMKCAFCASGLDGLVRNLSAGEVYGQVIAANKRFENYIFNGKNVKESNKNEKEKESDGESNDKKAGKTKRVISNVVFMGSGEPLDNYDVVTKSIKLLCDENGLNLSQRGISLSTCGLPDKMRRLADDGYSVTLSISLHATTDEIRHQLMPVSKSFSIHEVLEAARYYFEKTGRRVAIEYIMIGDTNISFFDAKRLKELTRGMSAHVNLIPLHYVKESGLRPATKEQTDRFFNRLKDLNVSISIRKSAGKTTDGACGQLRTKYVEKCRHD